MAVKKPSTKGKKPTPSTTSAAAKSKSNSTSKSKSKSKHPPRAKPEVKTKRAAAVPQKKKKKEYTDAELGLPQLNGIIPTGVEKPRGKKKGKVFVDDADTMLGILAVVTAEKDGEREGKVLKEVCSFLFSVSLNPNSQLTWTTEATGRDQGSEAQGV
jgi:60S ribosomal subunit assembly/export protein LOC1